MSQLASNEQIESDGYRGAVDQAPCPPASGSSVKVAELVPEPSDLLAPSASSTGKKSAAVITRDQEYFIESAFMVFEVEECLFRVPSYLFSKESHVFGGMFHLPQPHADDEGNSEGSSESNPIKLLGDTKEDFRCVLKALYPLSFTFRLLLSKSEWLSILKFSTKYYFLTLRRTAINELNRTDFHLFLTSLEKINHGRKCFVSSWIISGLVDLVLRDQSINDDEGLDIDLDYPTTAYKLFRTREQRLRGSSCVAGRPGAIKEIEGLFKEELDRVRADEKELDSRKEEDIRFEQPFKAKGNTEKEKEVSWGFSEEKQMEPQSRRDDSWGSHQDSLSPAPSFGRPKRGKKGT